MNIFYAIILPIIIINAIVFFIKKSGNPNKNNIVVKKYDFSKKSEEDRYVTESAFNNNLQKQLRKSAQAIYQYREINASEEKELKLEYFFYTNKSENAEALTKEIRKLNYSVNRSIYDEEKKVFVVTGWTTKMKITDEVIKKWPKQMCQLGYQFDCEFDVLVGTSGQNEMESILNKYLDFSSAPEYSFNASFVGSHTKLFNAISQHIKDGDLINVIKGDREYSTFKYVHPGSFAMPYEDTCISSLFSIFYVLIDNDILKKEAITTSLIELSKKEDYLYIFRYLFHYQSWINTENDIVLDWRSLVEYINKEYLEKGFEIKDDKFLYNNFMKSFNEKNFGVRFMIKNISKRSFPESDKDVLETIPEDKVMIQELDRNYFKSIVEKNKLIVKQECKQEHPEVINLENYRKYYLYGVVKSNPDISLRNIEIGCELYRKVIGNQDGIIIGNALHPYFIFDKDVLDIWDFVLIYEFKNHPEFNDRISNNKITLMELSSKYDKGLIWDKGAKLTGDNNQFYAVYVPFIIPFLVYEETRNTEFDKNSSGNIRIDKYGNPYLDEINTILKKFIPEQIYALGFDELINGNYEQIIDNFINIQEILQLHLLTVRKMKNL